jgi:hypothetical protein
MMMSAAIPYRIAARFIRRPASGNQIVDLLMVHGWGEAPDLVVENSIR